MEDECRAEFVRRGGLLVVKHWLLQWDEENRTQLLSYVLRVLKDLPITYDLRNALQMTGIAKAVKRVKKKRKAPTPGDTPAEKEAVAQHPTVMADEVMCTWSNRMRDTKPATPAVPALAKQSSEEEPGALPPSLGASRGDSSLVDLTRGDSTLGGADDDASAASSQLKKVRRGQVRPDLMGLALGADDLPAWLGFGAGAGGVDAPAGARRVWHGPEQAVVQRLTARHGAAPQAPRHSHR